MVNGIAWYAPPAPKSHSVSAFDEGAYQSRSSTSSPVKSPTTGENVPVAFSDRVVRLPPGLKSQIESEVDPAAYHAMSSTPSPVKSPARGRWTELVAESDLRV